MESVVFAFVLGFMAALVAVYTTDLPFSWKTSEDFRNVVISLAALIGVPLLYWRARSTEKSAAAAIKSAEAASQNTLEISRGKTSEIFSRAIEQLSSPAKDHLATRVGAIYTLENVAKNLPELHSSVMETLAAFVRLKAPLPAEDSLEEQIKADSQNMTDVIARRADVQAALFVLGRRNLSNETDNEFVDLSYSYLHGAFWPGCDLTRTILTRTVLSYADLRMSKLTNTFLDGVDLRNANLEGADLRGADPTTKSNFANADLSGSKLAGVDLSQANGLSKTQIASANLDEGTLTPWSLDDQRLVDLVAKHLGNNMEEINAETDELLKQEKLAQRFRTTALYIKFMRPSVSDPDSADIVNCVLKKYFGVEEVSSSDVPTKTN